MGVSRNNHHRTVCIRAHDVRKVFHSRHELVVALDRLGLRVYDGEFFCLVGPSGCGKTTLLRILAGLIDVDGGTVAIHKEASEDKPLTSMVFQEHGIFPWKTVRDNVAFGLKMRGMDKRDRYTIARRHIENVHLSGFENAYPHQLSGGMKQRVGIARAFANDPAILLMDEPFGSLDYQTKTRLQTQLLSLWEETRKTVVYVTHDIEEAIRLGDRIGIMTARPGRVKEIITVDLHRPRSPGTAAAQEMVDLRRRIWDQLDTESHWSEP